LFKISHVIYDRLQVVEVIRKKELSVRQLKSPNLWAFNGFYLPVSEEFISYFAQQNIALLVVNRHDNPGYQSKSSIWNLTA
jgi:hypothetical protein